MGEQAEQARQQTSAEGRPPLSLARKLLFGVLTTLLVLGGGEGLAWALLGPPPPLPPDFLIPVSASWLEVRGSQATLRHRMERRQDVSVQLAKGKRPRVVILGGSTVRNDFRAPEPTNFPYQLQQRMPDVEVVNFGTPGQLSAGVARLSLELKPLKPDLVVIYDGHNDFSAIIFAGQVKGINVKLIPYYIRLSRTWLGSILSRGIPSRTPPRMLDVHRGDRTSRPIANMVSLEDPMVLQERPQVLERFRAHLSQAVSNAPAPVLVCTLLRNFDRPPRGLLTQGHPTCAQVAGEALAGAADGETRLEQACGVSALQWWLAARRLLSAGQKAEALAAWRRSLALDPLPMRAPLEADDIAREVARDEGAGLADLAEKVGPFVGGSQLFMDEIHFTPEGAALVAAALEPEIRRQLKQTGK